MPFHFCIDELMMLMAALPFLGALFRRVHTWYHTKFGHKCHEENCNDKHVDHDAKRYVIRMTADGTEIGLMEANVTDHRILDVDGNEMPVVKTFEAKSWTEAKFIKDQFMEKL